MLFASTVGSIPMFDGGFLGYKANLAAAVLMRPLLGFTWAFLVYIMLTKENLAWYRPARWLKKFLELSVWTPIANLSYSIYLTHIVVLYLGWEAIDLFKSEEEMKLKLDPTIEVPKGCP